MLACIGATTLGSQLLQMPSAVQRPVSWLSHVRHSNAWLQCLQMKEGQIEDGSAAWQAMSAADRTKRTRAAVEAKLKLKSPNFFVSRTRLCLRNLPHQISEKALKDLIIAAVGP